MCYHGYKTWNSSMYLSIFSSRVWKPISPCITSTVLHRYRRSHYDNAIVSLGTLIFEYTESHTQYLNQHRRHLWRSQTLSSVRPLGMPRTPYRASSECHFILSSLIWWLQPFFSDAINSKLKVSENAKTYLRANPLFLDKCISKPIENQIEQMSLTMIN